MSGKLSSGQLARYHRQIILPGVGRAGQEKIARARVLIIGLGGLGSSAAYYLAAAGVGTLGLADFDVVEETNLHRQIIHGHGRIGMSKWESASRALRDINPDITLHAHVEGLQPANARDIICGYDLVVDGADNFPTRYLANDAAFLEGKPLVHGSVYQFEGQVMVFDPAQGGPCYRCLFPAKPRPGAVPNCAEAGVFGALCGIVGSMQAVEALKLIGGIGTVSAGVLLSIQALDNRQTKLTITKDDACPLCGAEAAITDINADNYAFACDASCPAESETTQPLSPMNDSSDLPMEMSIDDSKAWLESDQPPLLVDVREPHEVDICQIEGSLKIPMGSIPDSLDALPKDRPVLVHCHHGGRSMRVTQYLRERGFDKAVNMGGGIDQWAEKYDSDMQRY